MTRLEKYKDILIPVDDVAYVEYRKPDKKTWSGHDYDEETGTFVRIRNGAFFNMIKISKKNVLEDFKTWYDETMKRIGKGDEIGNWHFTYGPNVYPGDEEKPFDVSPLATWSSTTTVQHDGMEHPL